MSYRIQSHLKKSLCIALIILSITGCQTMTPGVHIQNPTSPFPENTIISSKKKGPVTFEALMADLKTVRVIYIGEQHTSKAHHDIQLKIIEELSKQKMDLSIGMEMFAVPYQPVLDQWSRGELDTETFLEKIHWYAAWGYPFSLYEGILDFARTNRIKVVALNIPFHIPPKISIGGIENLLPEDKAHLPKEVDTTVPEHKAFLEDTFKNHRFPGMKKFDYFYSAQCVWEDKMAESIAEHLGTCHMVVLLGNGHIIHKFGVPNRAFKRNNVDFRTIYLTSVGSEIDMTCGDYIWVTPVDKMAKTGHPMR